MNSMKCVEEGNGSPYRHFGIEPVERVELKDEEVGRYIEDPVHYRLARQLAMRADTGGESLAPEPNLS